MSKRVQMVLAVALAAPLALVIQARAGKPERDKIEELTPKVAEAAKTVTKECGCPIKITVNWPSYPTADDMFRIPNNLEAFTSVVVEHCKKPADKKAVCANLTGMSIGYSKEGGTATLKGKVIATTSSDVGVASDNLIQAIVDKF